VFTRKVEVISVPDTPHHGADSGATSRCDRTQEQVQRQIDEARPRYEQGSSLQGVAGHVGVATVTVWNAIRASGGPRDRGVISGEIDTSSRRPDRRSVEAPIATPTTAMSPGLRRYPHVGFFRANRSIVRRVLTAVDYRPARCGESRCFATSRRCRPSSVSDLTMEIDHRSRRMTP